MLYHIKEFIPCSYLFRSSFLAVDLFFLMSGFVIAHSYQDTIIAGRISPLKFIYQRFLRLYPLYIMASVVGGSYFAFKMVMNIAGAPSVFDISLALPSSLLLLPAAGADQWGFGMFPFAPSAWSLSLEFWFSIVFALFFLRLNDRALFSIVIVSSALLVHQMIDFGTSDLGWGLANWAGGAVRFWVSFTLGVLVWRRRHSLVTFKLLSPPIALIATFAFISLPDKSIIAQTTWIFLVFPAFLLSAIMSEPRGFMRIVSNHMGRLSYAIYIFHAPVILLTLGALKAIRVDAAAHPYMTGACLTAAVILISALATYVLDEPFRAWARQIRSRRSAVVPVGLG